MFINDGIAMDLPNYFIADLPPEAMLLPVMIGEACQTLKRNRELYLAKRSLPGMGNFFATMAGNWLDPEFPFRKLALDDVKAARFSRATLERGLDNFFRQLTRENF